MSGGVDSSVSALLLKNLGYDVTGIFMKNWSEENDDGVCTSTEDYKDVSKVAAAINIPYYTVNFEKEYWDNVFSYFLEEYKNGRTPNPDVMCNTEIKFNAFLNYAMKLKTDYIAMGHYARVKKINGKYYLLRGKDRNKDQSYFLSRITQEALSKTIFPIGDMEKSLVRKIAIENNLKTATKKDSTGICFIGERNFDNFLNQYIISREGEIQTVDGKVIGKHKGLIHYTYGQRRGIGIGGVGNGEPWFVAGKNIEKNILYVVQGENNIALFTKSLYATDMKWITDIHKDPFKCTAKFRYRQNDIPVEVYSDGNGIKIIFDEPVKAVTPGQVAVLYDGDICLGGAIIKTAETLDEKYQFLYPMN